MDIAAPVRHWRLLLVAAAVAGATACAAPAGTTTTPAAPASPPGVGLDAVSMGGAEAAPTPPSGPTKVAAPYPGTARAYAEAVIAAWTHQQIGVLGSLTTPGVQEQIIEIPQPLDDAWTYLRCDGTAGSSYCMFTNANGDECTLRISHALLGQAHAAIGVTLDQTGYPKDGIAYVKAFVAAWQIGNTARLHRLGTDTVVNKLPLGAPPVNPSYPAPTCCGGGLLQVTVTWTGGTARFDVGTTLLGGPHAVIGYTRPPVFTAN